MKKEAISTKKKALLILISVILIIILILSSLMLIEKKDSFVLDKNLIYENSNEIMCDLYNKVYSINSFGYDLLDSEKRKIKRMYFVLDKNLMRSEWINEGENYIFISNNTGHYEYFPERNQAEFTIYESEKMIKEFECSEETIQKEGYKIIGEEIINNKKCYLAIIDTTIPGKNIRFMPADCFSKEGLKLAGGRYNKEGFKIDYYHDNFEFNLSPDLFKIPKDVEVIFKED
jgi:hypothetical protein